MVSEDFESVRNFPGENARVEGRVETRRCRTLRFSKLRGVCGDKRDHPDRKLFFFYDVDQFLSLYWICYNIVYVFFFFFKKLLLLFWFLGCDVCRLFLAPRPGMEPPSPASGGGILTTRLPGESQKALLLTWLFACTFHPGCYLFAL